MPSLVLFRFVGQFFTSPFNKLREFSLLSFLQGKSLPLDESLPKAKEDLKRPKNSSSHPLAANDAIYFRARETSLLLSVLRRALWESRK